MHWADRMQVRCSTPAYVVPSLSPAAVDGHRRSSAIPKALYGCENSQPNRTQLDLLKSGRSLFTISI